MIEVNSTFTLPRNGLEYKVDSTIGDGGSSQVFRCSCISDVDEDICTLDFKKIVVKASFATPEHNSMCSNEIEVLIYLSRKWDSEQERVLCPFVELIAWFDYGPRKCLVFPCGDVSLAKITSERFGQWHTTEIKHLARSIIKALVFLHHKAGVIHSDLKPSNIVIESSNPNISNCSIKIIDFGHATFIGDAELLSSEVHASITVYSAPEYASERTWGPAVDAWALGIILFSLCNACPSSFCTCRSEFVSCGIHGITNIFLLRLLGTLLSPDPEVRSHAHQIEKRHADFLDS